MAHHPMGTARMAGDAQHGVTDPFGAVHGVQDLYVADASVLPSAITVAPQTTIAALALRTAHHISNDFGAPLLSEGAPPPRLDRGGAAVEFHSPARWRSARSPSASREGPVPTACPAGTYSAT